MCMTPESELALYAQQDDMMEWGTAHVRLPAVPNCGTCNPLEDLPGHPQIDAELRTSSWSDEAHAVFAFIAPAVASVVAFALLVWGAS